MEENKLLYVGQKAFIDRGGEVLVINDPSIGIDFPGGKIQKDEKDIIEALKREVREETALEIDVGEVFYSWLFKFPPHPDFPITEVYLVAFRCRYISGDVKLSHEHDKFQWVNKDNYKKLGSSSPHYKALEKYFE